MILFINLLMNIKIIQPFIKKYYIVNPELFLSLQAEKLFPITLLSNDKLIKEKKNNMFSYDC